MSVYGLDRASFNQGQNAKYDFTILEELQPTLTARGPGGGMRIVGTVDGAGIHSVSGTLVSRDYKGACNEWIDRPVMVLEEYE